MLTSENNGYHVYMLYNMVNDMARYWPGSIQQHFLKQKWEYLMQVFYGTVYSWLLLYKLSYSLNKEKPTHFC